MSENNLLPSTTNESDFEAAFAEAAEGRGYAEGVSSAQAGTDNSTPAPSAGEALRQESEIVDEDSLVLRQRLDDMSHRERSSASRVSVFMKENNQLKASLADLQQEMQGLRNALQAAAREQPEAASEIVDDPADALADAPELKAAVNRRVQAAVSQGTRQMRADLDAAKAQLADVSKTARQAAAQMQPLISREEQREADYTLGRLDTSFPQWRVDVRTEQFNAWLAQQPQDIVNLYENGRTFDQSAPVLKLYYADIGAPAKQAAQPPATDAAKNNQRLLSAAGIAPRQAVRPSVGSDDFYGAFAEFAQKKNRN